MDELDAAMDGALNIHDEWLHAGREEGFLVGSAQGSLEGRALGRSHGRAVAAEAGFMRGACLGVMAQWQQVPGSSISKQKRKQKQTRQSPVSN